VGKYILYRILGSIPVLIGVLFVVFMMVRLVPGDPVRIMLEGRPTTEEQREEVRREMGLDRPIPQQFATFVAGVAQGDLGESYRTTRPVTTEIIQRMPNTLKLAGAALAVTVVFGIGIGMVAAVKKGSWLDFGSMGASILAVSIPNFWFGMMLMLLFAVTLGWFPVSGADSWKHLILPAAALGLRSSAVLARVTRSTLLEVLNLDYVRTARAKGLRDRLIIYRHAMPNTLIPILTLVGLEIGALLTGAFIIEVVFSYPGMGWLLIESIAQRDFPVIQGVVLLTAVGYILINLAVDVLYAFTDPRIRYD
jgi:peptide/nickel transport system permease protein